MATDNGNTVAVFNYLDDGLNWYQADEDYYDYTDDDPEISPVQVGFNKGGDSGTFYTLSNYTLTRFVLDLDSNSNRGKLGQWTFAIGSENVSVGEVEDQTQLMGTHIAGDEDVTGEGTGNNHYE